MSSDTKFRAFRANKMQDWLDREVRDWAEGLVMEHFGVEQITDLSHKEICEVIDEYENIDHNYGDTLANGFAEVIRYWEEETGEDIEW